MVFQDAVPLLPTAHMVALLEEESMAIWVPDTQGTQTDIMGGAREMNILLQIFKLMLFLYMQ